MMQAESAGPGPVGPGLNSLSLPQLPTAGWLWSRTVILLSVLVLLYTLDRVTVLMGDFWLLNSLGLDFVFWTNFRMGATLYVLGLVSYAAAAIVPAYLHDLKDTGRSWVVMPGVLFATVAAYALAMHFLDFLFGGQEIGFNEVDPVFGKDIGFYVFDLPYFWVIWGFALGASLIFLVSSTACAHVANRGVSGPRDLGAIAATLGRVATGPTRVAVALLGILLAAGAFLARYELLLADNSASSVYVGAEYIDVTGLFSTLNYLNLSALIIVGLTAAVVMLLGAWNRAVTGGAKNAAWPPARLGRVMAGLLALDFVFMGVVQVRDEFLVEPNEPVIQLEYIARHVAATRKGAGLEGIERIEWKPNSPGAALPDPEVLINSPALRNAPLWPGFSSYLERLLDPQHADRILATGGDPKIYGPTLDLFEQEQKLRTYYKFINVDHTRYTVDGEQRLLVSGVRELPLGAPYPWLSFFGQRFMLFTHGFGLVAAPANEITEDGGLLYVSKDIPASVDWAPLKVANERIYYGEGADSMSFSNVEHMKELDYPTNQDRAELWLPEGETTGVLLDSIWKRLAIGWRSGHLVEVLFSDLIKDTTRVHIYREPLVRLERIAPFLYFDSNPYAVAAGETVVWMINAMSISDRYPYARYGQLGDKSDQRMPKPRHEPYVNYVEDSVKATIDAYTGEVSFYQIGSDPIISTWASIYPGAFKPIEQMPKPLLAQLTYPTQLFHYQFDDLYILYHMNDPMYFFNLEDMWDDADEVLGPLLSDGKSITFSIEPYPLILNTGGYLPKSSRKTQYTLMMPFTPEVAKNLRAITMVYQDWPDYGKRTVLEVPKGTYVTGTEQADAMIDQDPYISQQFAWWTRRGMEVIRGHTITIPLDNEVLFVEPIFLRSRQNPATQFKRVIVVFRDRVAMAPTLQSALNGVYDEIAGNRVAHEQALGRNEP